MRRVLVYGGRDFTDRLWMEDRLRLYLREEDVVVHGGAPGADSLAGDIAGRVLRYAVEVYNADWYHYGKKAGPIRNQEMLDSGLDYAIAFPGGRGTKDMTKRLEAAGIPILKCEERPQW